MGVVGSNPAAVLVLTALFLILVATRWGAAKLMEGPHMEQHKEKNGIISHISTVKPRYDRLIKSLSYALETTWGIGMSVVAGVVNTYPPFRDRFGGPSSFGVKPCRLYSR